jgi:hypothetical protein
VVAAESALSRHVHSPTNERMLLANGIALLEHGQERRISGVAFSGAGLAAVEQVLARRFAGQVLMLSPVRCERAHCGIAGKESLAIRCVHQS